MMSGMSRCSGTENGQANWLLVFVNSVIVFRI